MEAPSKTCTRCKETLPSSSYHRLRIAPDGHQYGCKECLRKSLRERRDKDPEADSRRLREYRKRLKREVFDHFGSKCTCCGESEFIFLAIDHINGNGAQHRREIRGKGNSGAGYHMYAWLKRNNYPEGFQILCHNCNWAKSRGGCPHMNEDN
jgi:hypothetical protein